MRGVLVFLFTFSCCIFASYFDDPISEEQCQCVAPHLCADNDKDANGQGLLDIRFENDACPNHNDVCCDMPLNATSLLPAKCGYSKANNFNIRITSDSDKSQAGELPWNVLIYPSFPQEKKSFICGGSLIHPQVVITAGHCVANIESQSMKVKVGEWKLRKKKTNSSQIQAVKEIIVHSQYRPGTLWNDIALVILDKPFSITANIGFICLPEEKIKIDEDACVASGWGAKGLRSNKMSNVLRKVTLPLVERKKCQQALRTTKLGRSFKLHRSFLCAGGETNRDTCRGDGGNPLICPVVGEEGRFVQVGLVSWGIGCGESNTPGVYVNVALYNRWIRRIMKERNFSTDFYKM